MTNWEELNGRVGNCYQVAGTRHYALMSGFAKGTYAIDVKTGSGLEYTVLPDRGMDISLASYKGTNLVYMGPNGEANPAFFDRADANWLYSFHAGLLTGCGPLNIGPPCEDEGAKLGLHGSLSNTPAEKVCDLTDVEKGELCVSGEMKTAILCGSQLKVKRTIKSAVGGNTVEIEDRIKNEGGKKIPLVMLYHINFGYPMLDDCVRIEVNGSSMESYTDFAAGFMDTAQSFLPPDAANDEKNYLHKFEGVSEGKARITNPKLGMYAEVSFDTADLPYLTQWKMEGYKDYVLGLEPCNSPCVSRTKLREDGLIRYLEPGGEKVHRVKITVGEI